MLLTHPFINPNRSQAGSAGRFCGLALVLLAATVLLTGCDQSQPSGAESSLIAARQAYEKANRGFPDPAEEGQAPQPLQQFRQQALEQAELELQSVIESGQASEAQVRQARRLLADTYMSKARRALKTGNEAMGPVRQQSGELLSRLAMARRSETRAGGEPKGPEASDNEGGDPSDRILEQLFLATGEDQAEGLAGDARSGDRVEANRNAISQLEEALEQQRQKVAELEAQIAEKKKPLNQARDQMAKLEEQAKDRLTEAQKLRQTAFTAAGEKQHDTLDEAAEIEAKGNELSFQADHEQVTIEQLERELSVLEKKKELRQNAIERIEEQIARFEDHIELVKQQRAKAREDRQQALEELTERFGQLRQQYEQEVVPPFATALKRVGQAIDQLKAAREEAPDQMAERLGVELVGAHLEQAYVLMQQAMTIAPLLQDMRTLAEAEELADQESFREMLAQLEQTHQSAIDQLTDTIDSGNGLAVELADEASGSLAERAERQGKRLREYANLVEQRVAQSQ